MTEITHIPSDSSIDIQHDFAPCVQCGCCSAFREVAFLSADTPRKVIRFLQRDNPEKAVKSSFLMLCKQCQTCSLTCPQGVDVAEIMRRLVRYRFLNY